ncbi:hypothetical protein JOE63_000281 [Cellulosimicrobium cellulans]|nr:hypothetical protein [Cellulosimicrobium cellulans]
MLVSTSGGPGLMLRRQEAGSVHVVCATARAGGDSGTDGTRDRYAGEGRRGALRARRLRRRSRALVRCPAGLQRRVMAEFSTSRVLDQPSSRPAEFSTSRVLDQPSSRPAEFSIGGPDRPVLRHTCAPRPLARLRFTWNVHGARGGIGYLIDRLACVSTARRTSLTGPADGAPQSQCPATRGQWRRGLSRGAPLAHHETEWPRAGSGMFHVKRRAPAARTSKGTVFHVKRASSQRRRGAPGMVEEWDRDRRRSAESSSNSASHPRAILLP